ncbi:MAG: ATP-dependent DNA helicase PcrA, partial [Lachnospiraceae bacterium]|nr:ATP-dependent DNA helicase PcrA [Lachnospiraceae bacterium]
CYVGITRAERVLLLSGARERMLWGSTQYNKRSRFVDEIPRYMLAVKGAPGRDEMGKTLSFGERKTTSFAKSPYAGLFKPTPKDIGSGGQAPDFGVGDRVKHIKFGVGTVKDLKKGGRDYEVTVEFSAGIKKMLLSFANLKKI